MRVWNFWGSIPPSRLRTTEIVAYIQPHAVSVSRWFQDKIPRHNISPKKSPRHKIPPIKSPTEIKVKNHWDSGIHTTPCCICVTIPHKVMGVRLWVVERLRHSLYSLYTLQVMEHSLNIYIYAYNYIYIYLTCTRKGIDLWILLL